MKNLRRTYISLGSNLGDKLAHLKNAVQLLSEKAGNIVSCSTVYQTPAWGFEGDDFYNACLSLNTELTPEALLSVILEIETSLGRLRSDSKEYTPRTIDIDILFYEDEIIDKKDLKVPHPHLHKRKFVLAPLSEIAPGKIHPQMQKTIGQLLDECEDDAEITKAELSIWKTGKGDFSRFNFIAIEGNIGAGKTTLATKIANDFNGKLILERFADNPFLPKFYEDRQRYAFPLEMSFLADRYQQFSDDTSQFDLFRDFMVSDYDIFKSLIFAKVTLQEEEFKLYRKVFNFMYKEVRKPDLYVYLYQNTARLLENIKRRGRDYEQNIPGEYLEEIQHGYFDFIKTQTDLNVLVLDISDMDFVKSSTDYQEIIDKITDFSD
ncbi:2-amino-4-hydroxy-6-hydroxymethyldihydropteridine diphosphokinase [Leptobacterium flavescens]|uniref:2-amino-4-hydroxy-6-hydroxymethyldihydropteridine pyrophosphokinase n=1 Tax=Leptobacterium flavescens TaxID=472055 RepID=A0A6P0UH57_9FLAO|nr:2-amino-4-hydroxy-6-hydroxymethyldihydropteridine diphosphokinase [Leptobacterium flavescens]NER12595.1 2-amino-4-hydroxy-6-hydroxymethyldihydropteridine diphosphokinase [Leptobacterium flavescens]